VAGRQLTITLYYAGQRPALNSLKALLSSPELMGVDWLPLQRSEDQVISLWTRIVPARFRLQITKNSSHPTWQFDRPMASRTFRYVNLRRSSANGKPPTELHDWTKMSVL
jgi:hypothetical protein